MKKALTVAIGLAWAILSANLLGLVLPRSAEAKSAATRPEARPPLVVVRALGPTPRELLRHSCRSILDAYPVRCEIREGRSLFSVMSAWNDDRDQIDARGALDLLFRDHAEDAMAELYVTGVDIYETRKPYVFGLASLTDRVALVSLARIDDDPRRINHRLHKLVLHEVAHTMGLHHHNDRDCVMRQDPTTRSLDTAPESLCEHCHQEMVGQAAVLSRSGQVALDRARGYLVRGETEPARQALVDTLWSGTYDLDVLHDFGQAFFDARQFNEAISVMRFVLKQDPDRADVHVSLGLAYQMRRRSGDKERAIAHLQTALDLRPDWKMVATHLAGLSSTEASAQGPE